MKRSTKSTESSLKKPIISIIAPPYKIPDNWIFTRLGDVVEINPSKPKLDFLDEQICSFLPMTRVDSKTGKIEKLEKRLFGEVKKGYTYFESNDVLFAKITPCMENGNIVIAENLINDFGFGSTEFYVLRPTKYVYNKYIYYLLRSENFRAQAKTKMTGAVGQQRVPKNYLEDYPLPLPPLKEQMRIANKIEYYFGEIDKADQLIEEASKTFELRRKAILDKAFCGDLTKNWRANNLDVDSVIERFDAIKKERHLVVESNREKKELEKMFEEFDVEKSSDEKGWLYLKANMFCHNISSGGTPSKFISEAGEIPFLKVYNIVNNEIDFEYKPQYIPEDIHESKLKKSMLQPDDVIMNIVGPPLKKIAIIPNEYPKMNMNQAIVRFRPIKHVLPKYIYYCLQYDKTLNEVMDNTTGVVGQVNISISQSRSLVFPVPSLKEQSEILMLLENLLDKEKKALNLIPNSKDVSKLKQSILSKAYQGKLGTNVQRELNPFK